MKIDYFNHPVEKISRAQSAAVHVAIGYLKARVEGSHSKEEVKFAKELLEVIEIELAPVLVKS